MKIEKLIEEQKWENISSEFDPKDIAENLTFLKSLELAYNLLYNKDWNENIQEFAVKLLEAIKSFHLKEWSSSWKYDAFLGLAYDIILKYDERYKYFKMAVEKTNNPPPQLLIALARCSICPGKPPISYDQSIEYLNVALKDYLYVDGVGLLRKIYWLKDDLINEAYWANILEQIENKNIDSPSLDLNFSNLSQ